MSAASSGGVASRATFTASTIARVFLGEQPAFIIPRSGPQAPWELLLYLLLGALAAFIAVGFTRLLYWMEDRFDSWKFPDALKPGVGGLMLGSIAFFYPAVLGLGFAPGLVGLMLLAARLLRTANCALFKRGAGPVRDLRTAIMRLGYKMVRSVSISLAAQQVFLGYATKPIRPYLKEVWKHSIQVGTLAYLLARYSDAVENEEAFLAGLLHEVGKLYILIRAKDHPELFRNEAAFNAIVADWQAELGRAITRSWDFSDELSTAIGEHGSCSLRCGPQASLTEVVAVANLLAERIGTQIDNDEALCELPNFGSLNLDPQTLAWVIAVSADEVHALQDAIGI